MHAMHRLLILLAERRLSISLLDKEDNRRADHVWLLTYKVKEIMQEYKVLKLKFGQYVKSAWIMLMKN